MERVVQWGDRGYRVDVREDVPSLSGLILRRKFHDYLTLRPFVTLLTARAAIRFSGLSYEQAATLLDHVYRELDGGDVQRERYDELVAYLHESNRLPLHQG